MKKANKLADGCAAHEADGRALDVLRTLSAQVDVLGEAELVVLGTRIQERLERIWAQRRRSR